MIIASLFFALMGAAVKITGNAYTSIQIVFYRGLFASGIIFFTIAGGNKLANKGGRPFLLIFRGLIGTLALYALFYNINTIGLGLSITYLQTAPIFVAIFSWIFLKETIKWQGWVAIMIGFTGILLIFRPDFDVGIKSNLLGLFNGIAAGAAYTSVRELRNYYDNRTIVLSFAVWGMLLPLLSMTFGEIGIFNNIDFLVSEFASPFKETWWALLAVGIFALSGQLILTKAYREGKAGLISAIGYLSIPFSIVIGSWLGDPWPDFLTIMGIILIITGGIIISWRRNL